MTFIYIYTEYVLIMKMNMHPYFFNISNYIVTLSVVGVTFSVTFCDFIVYLWWCLQPSPRMAG